MMTTLLFILMIVGALYFIVELCKASKDRPLYPPIEEHEDFYLNDDHYITIWRKNKKVHQ